MPHLGMPEIPGKKMKGTANPVERLVDKEIAAEAFKKDGSYVGSGRENVVRRVPGKSNIVFAHSFRGAEHGFRAKEIFYIHRIMKTLFPDHFLGIRAAFEHGKVPGGTVREEFKRDPNYVPPKDKNSTGNWLKRNFISKDTDGDFMQVREALIEMGIKTGIDYNPPNFEQAESGHEQYLDTAPGLIGPLIKNHVKIIEYMWTHGYDGSQVRTVDKSLKRLDTLLQERKKKMH